MYIAKIYEPGDTVRLTERYGSWEKGHEAIVKKVFFQDKPFAKVELKSSNSLELFDRRIPNNKIEVIKGLKAEEVLESVCIHYGITKEDIQGLSRKGTVVFPRQVCAVILKYRSKRTLTEIGELLGGRDHSTVISSIKVVKSKWQTRPEIRTKLLSLLNKYHIDTNSVDENGELLLPKILIK